MPEETCPTKLHVVSRIVLGATLVALGGWTLSSFLPSIAWAAIFAVATWPIYVKARRSVPHDRHDILLPLGFTLLVGMVFVVPVGIVGIQLGKETHAIMAWIHETRSTGLPVPEWLPTVPGGAGAVAWWKENLSDASSMSGTLEHLDGGSAMLFGRNIGAQVVRRVTVFTFTLMTLFVLYRSGPSVVSQMLDASARAFGPSGERVGRQIVASIHGTVDGLVLVGIAEGIVMGIAYAVAGVPHPTLLGAFTGVAAMLPFAAPVAFGLAALLLAAKGSVLAAASIACLGMVVLLVSDHLVRPALIGGATQLPFLWVLFGILGGVETWGLLGLFVGPALMSALILLWREWIRPVAAHGFPAVSDAGKEA